MITPANEELTRFKEFFDIRLTLAEEGRTLYELTTTEEQSMRDVANSLTKVSRNASAVLETTNNENFPEIVEIIETAGGSKTSLNQGNLEQSTIINEKSNLLFKIYPNPASNEIVIEVVNNENDEPLILEIYNVVGIKVAHEMITDRIALIRIGTSEWSNGVYYYNFRGNEKLINNGKITIIK